MLDFLNGDAFCLGVESKLIIFKYWKTGRGTVATFHCAVLNFYRVASRDHFLCWIKIFYYIVCPIPCVLPRRGKDVPAWSFFLRMGRNGYRSGP